MAIPKAKFGVVLGATTRGTQAPTVYASRILRAVQLYQDGSVEKLIFTGGPGKPPQAEVGRMEAMKAGVPSEAILIETQSNNTLENLFYAQELLPHRSLDTVLLVSDSFHLKRAMFFAEALQINAQPSPTDPSVYQSWHTKIKLLLRETLAQVYYRLQYHTGILNYKISKLNKSRQN